jgi:hypothetical protein
LRTEWLDFEDGFNSKGVGLSEIWCRDVVERLLSGRLENVPGRRNILYSSKSDHWLR